MRATLVVNGQPRVEVAYHHGPRLWALVANGRGVNFHRDGGLSVTGVPSSGGTTVCWGRMRERCERIDAEPAEWKPNGPVAWIRRVGPLMLRVGRDF